MLKHYFNTFIDCGGRTEDFGADRKEHRRRSNTFDYNVMATLQLLIDQDSGTSIRSEPGLPAQLSKRNCHIHYKSYVFRRGQFLKAAPKKSRLAKTKMLLNMSKESSTRPAHYLLC
jgi:hypothetical protein